MNDRLRDKLNMYVLVKDYLLASTSITSRWAGFAGLLSAFADYITEIFNVSGSQEEDKTGVTKTKIQIKNQLIDLIVDISGKCYAYATMAENFEFLSLIRFAKTDLMRMADADLVKTSKKFHENVLPQLTSVADYDLTQDDMDDLLKLSEDFFAIYTKPKGNKKDAAQLTKQVNALFALADKLLVKMDALIRSAHKKEPAFVDTYNSKRIIANTPSHTRAYQIKVLNDETGEPLPRAKVSVTSKSSGAELVKTVKRTGTQGSITNDSNTDGEHSYEVEYNGCVKETGIFYVNSGVTTKVVVRMKEVKSE